MIISGKTSQKIKQMNIEKRILQLHPYTITPPATNSGRWQTYIKPEGASRKILRAPSYDDLLEKLFAFYFNGISFSDMRLQTVFEEWLSYKSTITDSSNTIRRHEQHWNRYFRDTWGKKKLKSFDKLELQKQCNQLVKDFNLTSKEWQNIKTILNGVFEYAYEKEYIKQNPMPGVKITVKFRQINRKTGQEETFQTDEYNKLLQYLEARYTETNDSVYMALKLDLYVGLRIGELSALKWSDVIGLKTLHICREEVKESVKTESGWKEQYKIVDHTKTHTDRVVPLVPSAIAILSRLKTTQKITGRDGYIFIRNGERLTSRQITYALEKACSDLSITVKRTHKIRKTVASRLNSGGVPLDAIREILGHSTTATTLSYIYNPLTEKETYNLMSKAL